MNEINLIHVEGIDFYLKEMDVKLKIDDINNTLTITPTLSKDKPIVHIKFDQLIDCATIHNEMISEKDKSVLGRAIIGGVLIGGLGAVIGGMSGIGNKKKVKKTHYLVINYKSQSGDIKVLSFRMNWLVNLGEFTNTLKNRISKNNIEVRETYL